MPLAFFTVIGPGDHQRLPGRGLTRKSEEIAMPIARTLKTFLEENHIQFDTVEHAHTDSAVDSAKSAHIPPHQMAKAVVLGIALIAAGLFVIAVSPGAKLG